MANSAISRRGLYNTIQQGTYQGIAAANSTSDVDGPSIAITPKSTSSVIMCIGSMMFNPTSTATTYGRIRLLRDGSTTLIGDVQASCDRSTVAAYNSKSTMVYTNSPATTSSTTYKLSMSLTTGSAAGSVTWNGSTAAMADVAATIIGASSLILMELV